MEALQPYEPDTLVLDPEDMQQIHGDDGHWHRPTLDVECFACGQVINDRLRQARRPASYEGPLCREGCFSTFELAKSEAIERDRLRRISATAIGSQPIPKIRGDR